MRISITLRALLNTLLLSAVLPPLTAVAQPAPTLPEMKFVEVPAGARDKFIGDRFSYMETGKPDAPAVLLLHGIGANSFYWRFQYRVLGERYRVVAWNAPGYLLTDNLKKERPTCNDYADALAAFADAVGVGRAAVIGNSFGSAVAQCYAERYPARVERMALSGTSVGSITTPVDEREKVFERRQKQFERAGGMGYARDVIGLLLGSKAEPWVKPEVMAVLAGTNGPAYLRASFVAYELDSLAFAPRIKIPVLLVHGTEDKIAPIERTSVALSKVLPNAKLVRLEGHGHLPEVEAWPRVNPLLLEFLGSK